MHKMSDGVKSKEINRGEGSNEGQKGIMNPVFVFDFDSHCSHPAPCVCVC